MKPISEWTKAELSDPTQHAPHSVSALCFDLAIEVLRIRQILRRCSCGASDS